MLQFLSQKLGYGVTHLAASVLYATVEGVAFLFRPYGIATVLASEIVVSTFQNPRRVGRIFSKSIVYVVAGKMCLSYVALLRRNRARRDQDDVLNSIWDWNPPEDDLMASNTWFVLKELVFTLTKLKEEYPEIEKYLSRPEFAPMEMAPRLYYYLKKQDTLVRDDIVDDSSRMLESEEEKKALVALQQYKDYCLYSYDLTEDDVLEKALHERGYVLIGARYTADLIKSGSPAFYLAVRSTTDGHTPREIILCIRGTYSEDDVFIDLFAHGMTFGEHGMAHAGMTKAANYLEGRFGPFFEAFLNSGGDILTIAGHSLGAGVGSLLTLKLIERGISRDKIRCLAYEPPACMSMTLAQKSLENIWSLVNRDDIVPRLGPTPFLNLLHDLSEFDWRGEDEGEMPQILRMLTSLLLKNDSEMPSQDGKEESPGESRPFIATEYDPVVPGRVIYACPGKQPVCIDQCSPILRSLRLSSSMIKDHFIDTDEFGQALFSSSS